MRHARNTILALLLLSLSTPALGQNYFMYAPRTANPGDKTNPEAGVLVREIEVQKGDTLSGISRKFSGRGFYYPQILLFNDIKNPNRIYAGKRVRVPVRRHISDENNKQAPPQQTISPTNEPESELSLGDSKEADTIVAKKATNHSRRQMHKRAKRSIRKQATPAQLLFNQALASYRQKKWQTALEQFDRFLTDNPASELAAEASLYKADCYLKLSIQ